MKIRTLIIDDEPLARRRIKRLLAGEAEFESVGEAGGVEQALALCRELKPDLIFLDVQMHDGSGFDFLESLPSEHFPAVVFVTAYDEYTVRAFEFHAADYLLKPFSEERFRSAAAKARERLSAESGENPSRRIMKLLEHVKSGRGYLKRLAISHNNRLLLVSVEDIDWVTAYGNYLRVRAKGKIYLLRETVNNIAGQLNPENFVRIHRSTIVNVERINEFQPMFGGQYRVVLKDGTRFVLSRNYRKPVLSRFGA